jgi:hypothetical protein
VETRLTTSSADEAAHPTRDVPHDASQRVSPSCRSCFEGIVTLTPEQRAELEALGPENVRAKLSPARPGRASIHVSCAYGVTSFPYNDLGAIIDYNAQVLLVQKLLSDLARDPNSGRFKDSQKQRDDHQKLQPGGSNSCWGGGIGVGANP